MKLSIPPMIDPFSPQVQALVSNISNDNLSGLQLLLDSGEVSVDDRDENGITALMTAAEKGKLPFVKLLVEKGADVNAEDGDSWTPLLYAAKEGHEPVITYLLAHGADINHREMGGWTPLVWAGYKGRTEAVRKLVTSGADVDAHGTYCVTTLAWAAGRNFEAIVQELLRSGANVNTPDICGTTPIIWACRKGNYDIAKILLEAGADINAAGMNGWTALIVSAKGNYPKIIKLLLQNKPDFSSTDKDGCTALAYACKEGYLDIATDLIQAGAHLDPPERFGCSPLILAAKGGHRSLVDLLLKNKASVNVQARDRRSALYCAVEKSHVSVVAALLQHDADVNMATKEGDTPLMRATRNHNPEIVALLLEKNANVSQSDKGGETCLHMAMRDRHTNIVEMLLRNPNNNQVLYKENLLGETPYAIDRTSAKPVINQLTNTKTTHYHDDFENQLGYNLYSSSIADLLSDPTLTMPITVGLFAKWGNSQSFLLERLRAELRAFAKSYYSPLFVWSPLLFSVVFLSSLTVGLAAGVAFESWLRGLFYMSLSLCFFFTFLIIAWFYSQTAEYKGGCSHSLTRCIRRKLDDFTLFLQVIFCVPPGRLVSEASQVDPINFYFTEQIKISSFTGADTLTEVLKSLYLTIEHDYGVITTRVYRTFRQKAFDAHDSWRWRRTCCVPYIYLFSCTVVAAAGAVVVIYLYDMTRVNWHLKPPVVKTIVCLTAIVIGFLTIPNAYTFIVVVKAACTSHAAHLDRTVSKARSRTSETFLYALKAEVKLMIDLITCLDSFRERQSRMVICVDGLDTQEQEKVLQMLDSIHILFGDNRAPFIIIIAIDPRAISKGFENINKPVILGSETIGKEYLKNIVNLPFHLQNNARKLKEGRRMTLSKKPAFSKTFSQTSQDRASGELVEAGSNYSSTFPTPINSKPLFSDHSLHYRMTPEDSADRGKPKKDRDLDFLLECEDYFSELTPRSMRRLMNIIHITGRLLRAFNVDFTWETVGIWIHLSERWPYRLSWMLIYMEVFPQQAEESPTLAAIFQKVKDFIPDIYEDTDAKMDEGDEVHLESYLRNYESVLTISTIQSYLPFTVNLDPQIRKDIRDKYHLQQLFPVETQRYQNSFFASPVANLQTSLNILHHIPVSPQEKILMGEKAMDNNVSNSSVSSEIQPLNSLVMAEELKYIDLENKSVDDVVKILLSIQCFKPSDPHYLRVKLQEHNINGNVLLHCDLADLRMVLTGINFGDWELFKMVLRCIRQCKMSSAQPSETLVSTGP